MSLKETQIGVAFTGSFCTYKKAFLELQKLSNCCGSVQTVFSTAAASTDSRFGSAESFYRRAEEITGHKPMMTISEAEPIPRAQFAPPLVKSRSVSTSLCQRELPMFRWCIGAHP